MTLKRITRAANQWLHRFTNDQIMSSVFLVLIMLYVIAYGIFVTRGFVLQNLSPALLIPLIPILLVDAIKSFVESFFKKGFYRSREDISKITVVIATYNGESTLEMTIRDLLKKFEKGRIIVSSNGSTDRTVQIAKGLGVRVVEIKRPVGKVGAINFAMSSVRTPYTLIIDDDTLVGRAVFPTNALDEGYEAVAFRVFPVDGNWLTKIQAHEYRKSMDIGKGYQNRAASVQNISGAIGLFQTVELKRQIRLHSGEFSGEDLQRTLLIHMSEHTKGVVIADTIIRTVVPGSVSELFRQRIFGWNPGLFANIPHYLSILFSRHAPVTLRFDAFYNTVLVVGADPIRLIALPVLIFYPLTALVVYSAYVALETVPYLVMGRREPYWVVLAYPAYGLFNFVARIIALGVFLFRRAAVKLARMKQLDDYRHAPGWARFAGLGIAAMIFLLALAFRMYNPIRDAQTIRQIEPAPVIQPTDAPTTLPAATADNSVYVSANPGDSVWSLAEQAVVSYASTAGKPLSPTRRQAAVAFVTEALPPYQAIPGMQVRYPAAVLAAACEFAENPQNTRFLSSIY